MAELIDLNINIGANTTDFEGSLQKAQNLLKQFEAALKKATNVGEINYLNGQVKNLNTTISSLNQQMNKVGRPVGDATNALSNLSRVAQDAPYGFIGIANNLNPLLESFQRLQKETGSSANALKSMVAGLAGPAGIGIALGVVSSLAVTFSKEISEFFKGPTDKLKTFREELNKLNQDIYKIVGEAQSNRTVGLNLVNIISGGGTTSQQEEALKKLKSLYSENKAIKDATIQTDKAYLLHLVNVAAIQEDAAGKEKNTQQILSAAYAERSKLLEEQKNQIGKLKPIVTESTGIGDFGGKIISVESQKAVIEKRNKPILDSLNSIIATAKSKNLELVTTLTDIETPDPNNSPVVNYAREENKALTLELAKMKALREKFNKLDLTPILDVFNPNAVKEEDKRKSYFEKRAKENLEESNKSGLGDFLEKDSKKRIAAYKLEDKQIKELEEAYSNFANMLANSLTSGLMDVFTAIEEGRNPLEAIADMFLNIAKSIAAAVIQAAIFQAILTAFPELKAVFAASGALQSAFGGRRLAEGGITNGASIAMIGEAGPEAVLPLSKLNTFMQTSFNAGSMNGGGNMAGSSVAVLRGQDLLVAINRTQKSSFLKGQNISLA